MLEVHQRLRGSADQVKVRELELVPLVPGVALALLLNLLAIQ